MNYKNSIITENASELNYGCSWDEVKADIYPMLLPYKSCENYLSKIVYRPFLDLVVCYCIRIPDRGKGVLITADMLDGWEITEEELKVQAEENLKMDGYETLRMSEMIGEDIPCEGIPDMTVLTNKYKEYGAAGILYSALLRDYSELAGHNLILLPSSIHEWILLPDDGRFSVEEMRQLVNEVNREVLSAKDYLSDRVYYFDRKKNEVRIAA